ncbi:MAG: hypothetical protein ACRC1G_00980 [Bradyrhizobium sp.]|nr:hypothetical protein [Bradyrhizobium sp.]
MARARIVVDTTAVGAADGPVQLHGARSYSRNGRDVKTGQSLIDDDLGSDAPSRAINLATILH